MSTTEVTATLVGDTAASILPADVEWHVSEATAADLLPPRAPKAVGCRVDDHVIVVIVDGSMDRRLQVGPPPAEGVLDGLEPTVEAIVAVLGLAGAEPLAEVDPTAAIRQLPDSAICAVLHDGEDHLVSVVVTPPSEDEPGIEAEAATFTPIPASGNSAVVQSGLEVLHDVRMGVTAELGRTSMVLRDILQLAPGSVIELDRAASAPVDVMVNGTLIARGEVVVIDEEFGIRITEVVGYEAPRATLPAPSDGGTPADG